MTFEYDTDYPALFFSGSAIVDTLHDSGLILAVVHTVSNK